MTEVENIPATEEAEKKIKSKFASSKTTQAEPLKSTKLADDILEKVKGKFDVVVVVGLKDGIIDVATSVPQYPVVQWMLTRAQFELLIAEKANLGTPV